MMKAFLCAMVGVLVAACALGIAAYASISGSAMGVIPLSYLLGAAVEVALGAAAIKYDID